MKKGVYLKKIKLMVQNTWNVNKSAKKSFYKNVIIVQHKVHLQ